MSVIEGQYLISRPQAESLSPSSQAALRGPGTGRSHSEPLGATPSHSEPLWQGKEPLRPRCLLERTIRDPPWTYPTPFMF